MSIAAPPPVVTRSRGRPVTARAHAASDVVVLGAGLLAPFVLGYADDGLPAHYTFALVAGGVLLNLLTKYPLGAIRIVPLRVHRLIELTAPGVFVALPWYLFPGLAAGVLTALGSINFATALLTDSE